MGNATGVQPIINNLLYALSQEDADVLVLKKSSGSIFDKEHTLDSNEKVKQVTITSDKIPELVQFFSNILVERGGKMTKVIQEENLVEKKAAERFNRVFEYMQQNTKPFFFFLEDLDDFGEIFKNDPSSMDGLCAMFSRLRGTNCYVIACMYPLDSGKISNTKMAVALKLDQVSLLVGGNYSKQRLCSLPRDDGHNMLQATQANKGAMKYREIYHLVQMPCGDLLTQESDDPLDANIFE